MSNSLIDEYSVSGAFLLIGALSLHFCFFGMFFRPTQFETKKMTLSVSIDMLEAENQFRASKLSLALHGVEIRPASSLLSGLVEEGDSASRLRYGSVGSLLRRVQFNSWRRLSLRGLVSGSVSMRLARR